MKIKGRQVLVCSCERTMAVDAGRLAKALGAAEAPVVHHHLCGAEIGAFRQALADGEPLLVCCAQQAPLFAEIAAEKDGATPLFVDIRDRAGWSDAGAEAAPKMAALIAEASVPVEPTPAVTLRSDGATLVYARDEVGLEAARRLAGDRPVTCLLVPAAGPLLPPAVRNFALFCGQVSHAEGHLGAFTLAVKGLAAAAPSSRAALVFDRPVATTELSADVILDLAGQAPLFREGRRRDGYLRADPGAPAAFERAIAEASALLGEFEKPRYVKLDPLLCAHSRNGKVGCTKCLDACPTASITPLGDYVNIDAYTCSGHGACSAVCPTGAITYALPAGRGVFERLRVLLATYRRAGGSEPQLLVHDLGHGAAMIQALARVDRGLPATVLPFALNEVTALGLDFVLTAFAHGAARLSVLTGPAQRDELGALRTTLDQAAEILSGLGFGGDRLCLLAETDPTVLGEALRQPAPSAPTPPAGYQVLGRQRETLALALDHLHAAAPSPIAELALVAGGPFGRILLDSTKCTLCMSCVGVCPTAALGANADKPQLSFQESSCVQCGLCRVTCPENAIALEPRLVFGPAWREREVLKEEEPFACIRCGKPFGTRSTIDRMIERLATHPMFQGTGRLDLIKMCDTCRVVAQMEAEEGGAMAGPPRPLPRTSEDYLRERGKPPQ